MDMKIANGLEDLERLFATRMREYDEKLIQITSGTAPIHADLTSLSSEFNDFKSFVWQTLSNMKTQFELLTLGLDRQETSMRRKVLLIHGLPEKPNEQLQETVLEMFGTQMKIPDIGRHHIKACHRLGNRAAERKPRPVLVRFINMEQRLAVWGSKTSLKRTGITLSEFLTKLRHRVFVSTRKHFGINNCWSAEGKIVVITPDRNRKKIENMAEFEALANQFPSAAQSQNPTSSEEPLGQRNTTSRTTSKALKSSRRR